MTTGNPQKTIIPHLKKSLNPLKCINHQHQIRLGQFEHQFKCQGGAAWSGVKTKKIVLAGIVLLALAIAAVVIANLNESNRAPHENSWGSDIPRNSSTAQARATIVATRSGEEVVATAQAQRTATATARENARTVTAEAEIALVAKCEETARTATSVTSQSVKALGNHAVTVRVSDLEVDKAYVNPAVYGNAAAPSQDASFLVEECFWLLKDENMELPALLQVKRAADKAQKLVEATVAPFVTATAAVHATARAKNATVRSKNVTIKCERLRMAEAEANRFGANAYSHVANIMVIAADGVFFDSYDAKTALEQCP